MVAGPMQRQRRALPHSAGRVGGGFGLVGSLVGVPFFRAASFLFSSAIFFSMSAICLSRADVGTGAAAGAGTSGRARMPSREVVPRRDQKTGNRRGITTASRCDREDE